MKELIFIQKGALDMVTINTAGLVILMAIGYLGIDSIVKGTKKTVKKVMTKGIEEEKQ